MKHLFSLNKYFYKYRNKFLLGVLFVVLSNVFRVLQPQVIREALDQILLYINTPVEQRKSDQLSDSLMHFGFYIFLFSILMGLFMYVMRQTIIVVSRLIEYDLRTEIFRHYLSLDMGFYKRHKTGELMSRMVEDVNKVRMYLGPAMLYGINLISMVFIIIFTMFQVNAKLSCYTLLPLPVLSYIIYLVSNKINKKSEVIQQQLASITAQSQETFSGIRILKSYGIEQFWAEDFKRSSYNYKTEYMSLAKIDAMFFPSMLLLIGISTLITIYIGGLNVFEGTVTPGNIAEFVIYVTMLTWPVSAIGWCASIIQQAEASQKRINDFLNVKPTIQQGQIGYKSDTIPDIQLHHLSYVYPDTGIKALTDVHFSLKPGQKIAVVGRTASGKSSLAELFLRIQDPTEGTILINDVDLKQYRLEDIRQIFSYVPQDNFLFSDTILENVRFGNFQLSKENIVRYCQFAHVHEDIQGLPNGYDTLLGERGVNLSGGQKQRLSLARALAKDSKVVILDDCLSAVDSDTEQVILATLDEALNGRSLLMITQRIKQTQFVDAIFVLDQGKLVQKGTFETLIQEPGLFKTLYEIENQNKYQE